MADIKIYGRLRNATTENVIASTDQVRDEVLGKSQQDVNQDIKNQFTQTSKDLTSKIDELKANTDKAFNDLTLSAERVYTSKKLQVAGGPLAALLNSQGITEIDPSTNLQSLFKTLFTKELWSTPSFREGTINANIVAPSFSVGATLVEVGANVTVPKLTCSASTYSKTDRMLSGFTYGYSTQNNNQAESKNTSITAGVTVAVKPDAQYRLSRTVNGNSVSSTPNTTASAVTLDAFTFKAIEGVNTVKVDVVGANYNAVFAAMPQYFIVSNLENTNASKVVAAKAAQTITSNVPSNSRSLSVNGVYPYFAKTSDINSFAKLALTTSKTLEGITMPDETASSKHAFKIPAKYTVTNIAVYNTITKAYENQPLSAFIVTTENVNVQGNQVSYKVYTRNQGQNGSSTFKIIFK